MDLATGLTARFVNRVGEALRGNKRFDGGWRSVVRPTWPGQGSPSPGLGLRTLAP
ncbi:hypothetical protein [Streptomyces europaeiscabiei]|uniref:hypothetical protein n=1 Tax=Streptomyces europaeiscabiei TaxID=146819 RepID=UPI0038F60D2E